MLIGEFSIYRKVKIQRKPVGSLKSKLNELVKNKGSSLEDLATNMKELGYPIQKSTLLTFARNYRFPSQEYLTALCFCLDCGFGDLYEYKKDDTD